MHHFSILSSGAGIRFCPHLHGGVVFSEVLLKHQSHDLQESVSWRYFFHHGVLGDYFGVLVGPIVQQLSQEILAITKVPIEPTLGDTQRLCEFLNTQSLRPACGNYFKAFDEPLIFGDTYFLYIRHAGIIGRGQMQINSLSYLKDLLWGTINNTF